MSRRAAFAAAVVVSFVLPLGAQKPPDKPAAAPPQGQPTFRTETNFVRVDVFPTLKGVPVKDLTAQDFQILEDGKPQKLETFEFVQVRGGIPQEERQEPNTVQQARDALLNPRARVFVLFLDVPHVRIHGSWNVREPLIRLVDRVLGPEDLIGIMTPTMSARDVVFARKTEVIAGGLRDRWPWGERYTTTKDEREHMYDACFPWQEHQDLVKDLIARKRERATLEALAELVSWLRYEREERKAILTISEGWALYRPSTALTARVTNRETGNAEPVPGPEPIGTGPDGRIRLGGDASNTDMSFNECWADRIAAAAMDNDRLFKDIMDDANRGNASFYTVDPRGLAAFDAPIGPEPPPPIDVDLANLRHRLETLQVLAENTDGLAVINSNDLDKGLRRIADDLSSYYLLGYYTTNAKLDGRYRRIEVKVTRPGVDVRARRGYRAATREEVTAARAAASAPVPASVKTAQNVLASLGGIRPSAVLRTRAVAALSPSPVVWVAGELAKPAADAARVDITIMGGGGSATGTATIAAGGRGFVVPVPLTKVPTEPIDVRIRLAGAGGEGATSDLLRIDATPGLPHPVLYRRGPSTGNRVEPIGDPVYMRTERLRAEMAASAEMRLTEGRILDRNGNAVELPVTLGERTDASGQRWLTADVTLAALGAGDYILELSGQAEGASHKVLTAIRVSR